MVDDDVTKQPKRLGGSRLGAGRKPIGNEPMVQRTVTLPPDTITTLEGLGDGNLSAGIRRLVNTSEHSLRR